MKSEAAHSRQAPATKLHPDSTFSSGLEFDPAWLTPESVFNALLNADLQPWIDLTRVSKFAGTMVVFWPFAWGLTMAARSANLPLSEFLSLMANGFVGACLSHRYYALFHCTAPVVLMTLAFCSPGAGCVWNDILDREFDAKVERTKLRPVASGSVSVPGAIAFLGLHIVAMLSLIWKVNRLAWVIGLLAIFPLAGLYPLMKRITYWPQAWLGIAINIGIVMSWACTTGTTPRSSWVLSAGAWAWTIWYDTIYACQDKKDDVSAGVKSTALLFGSRVKTVLALFGIFTLAAITLSGHLNQQSAIFFSVGVAGGAGHMAWQLGTLDVDSPKSCWEKFHANGFYFGAIVEAGLLLDYLLL